MTETPPKLLNFLSMTETTGLHRPGQAGVRGNDSAQPRKECTTASYRYWGIKTTVLKPLGSASPTQPRVETQNNPRLHKVID